MKILFSSNISWSVYNFRRDLLLDLQAKGHDIFVLAEEDSYSHKLEELGFNYSPIRVNNNGKNPFKDFMLISRYVENYKRIQPDIILHNAIKPNIYGTIAASRLKIPTINNISGLGTLFIRKSISTLIAKQLYRFSQKKASIVFFQNPYDKSLFVENKLINKEKSRLIPGSGVDTEKFAPENFIMNREDHVDFLFVGRLLIDKGIREYVNAATSLKKKYPNASFNILGPLYKENSSSISENTLGEWVKTGNVNYLGSTDEVATEMAKMNCLVLPSYREGLSKVLIEASSLGLPIVTTDVPGCKDVVIDGLTGFLCQARDWKDLADKMEKMILLKKEDRLNMGKEARKRAIAVFDVNNVIDKYRKAVSDILHKKADQ